MNAFVNPNAEPWTKWIWRKSDNLQAITFYFLSKRNSTSPRFFPLYDSARSIRIVVVSGLPWRYTDWFMLLVHSVIVKAFTRRVARYKWYIPTNFKAAERSKTNVIYNLDDPTYQENEFRKLSELVHKKEQEGYLVLIVCTNAFTNSYLATFLAKENIVVLPQGHSGKTIMDSQKKVLKNQNFALVYSSPIIDIEGDKHAGHEAWDATHLLTEIIPGIVEKHSSINIHLVGRLGSHAHSLVSNWPQVIPHGLVSIERNVEILESCDLALYPRRKDNLRSVQKISEYMGCNLPVVTYDLVDTALVKELQIGVSVKTKDEFISAVLGLISDREKYARLREQVESIKMEYSWKVLAQKLDRIITES